jgi:DNA-binding MarR family transcriptional regulator
MSPVIFRLEKRKLVRREILPSDRRCHALFFDEAGEPTFLAAREKIRTFEENVAARLSRAEQRELARLLVKLQDSEAPTTSPAS